MAATLQLTLPDSLESILRRQVDSSDQLPRWVLEALVIEVYRERLISRGKVGELLGLPFHEREAFLASRGVPYNYDPADLEADSGALEQALGPISR